MINNQVLKFGMIGVANTSFSFILYMLFLSFNFSEGTSYCLSCISGLVISYHANKNWTFQSLGSGTRFSFFATVQLGLILFGSIIIELLNKEFESHHIINWLMVVALSAVTNFYICKKAVFRN